MYIQVFSPPNRELDSLVCRVEKNVNAEATPEEHKHSDDVYDKIGDWFDKHPSQHLYQDTYPWGGRETHQFLIPGIVKIPAHFKIL